jgi:hypothetical protein
VYIQDEDLHRADILRRLIEQLEDGKASLQGFDIALNGDTIQIVANIEPKRDVACPTLHFMSRLLGVG